MSRGPPMSAMKKEVQVAEHGARERERMTQETVWDDLLRTVRDL